MRVKSFGPAESCVAPAPLARFRAIGQRSFTSALLNNGVGQEPCRPTGRNPPAAASSAQRFFKLCFPCSAGVEEVAEYDPNLLSDPQWPCGRHKRVLIFASYMVRFCSFCGFLQTDPRPCNKGQGFCFPEFPAVDPGSNVLMLL